MMRMSLDTVFHFVSLPAAVCGHPEASEELMGSVNFNQTALLWSVGGLLSGLSIKKGDK